MVDLSLFSTNAEQLLKAVKELGTGRAAPELERALLERVGLAEGKALSRKGRDLFDIAWVELDPTRAYSTLGEALRVLLPVQVLDQELRGFGAIPEPGVENLLRLHGAVPDHVDSSQVRRTLLWLNKCKLVVYSTKLRTVRGVVPADDAAQAGEVVDLAAMISPRTPYSNLVRLRRVLRALEGVVYWADPHFGTRALEDLAFEVDTTRVREIRILSRGAENVVTTKSLKDFRRFQDELTTKGIISEWRVDPVNDWHDRWLLADRSTFNMPPVNNLYQNQYSEILPSNDRPPVEDWWSRARPR